MADLSLTMGFTAYDHVRDMFTGRAAPEGVDLTFLEMEVEETFLRFFRDQEWDVSEISFAMSSAAISRGEAPFVLIPVFPSRVFRHSAVYVRPDGPVKTPEDLAGKKIGQPQWAQTATVYVRGWLNDTVGVKYQDVEWIELGSATSGRLDTSASQPKEGISLTSLPGGSLVDLLIEGEIDALISAHPPVLFLDGDPRIKRLIPDYRPAEEQYFADTGIYPIMHTVALRRSSYEANRWIARNMFDAFERAKNLSAERLVDFNVSQIAVPWLPSIVEGFKAQFFPDGDYWPYGVERNRTTLEAFLKFCFDQGVHARHLAPEELFAPEALEPFAMMRV